MSPFWRAADVADVGYATLILFVAFAFAVCVLTLRLRWPILAGVLIWLAWRLA